ncbi:MAG: DEAD/DEAH box helicase family protein [Deltaproteobacteria bacterium]|nr:DEAD/DEAH box helicase family protein [Candidatus Tharpellaceae bacterium]
MSKKKLRPYQKSDIKLLKKALERNDHVLFGASVSFGKSLVIQRMVKAELKKGGKVLVITPRRKLTRQLLDTLAEFHPSILMGADTVYHRDSQIFCATTPTLNSRLKKQGKKLLGDISLILYDEVHISFNGQSMELCKKLYWDTAKWVGLSGTPIDAAGYRMENWDFTIYNHQMQDLVDLKYLTPLKVMVEEVPEGLDQVGMVGGDYNESQLAEFMSDEARVSNVYQVWKKYARKRKTMIFAVNIAHAEIIYNDFIDKGVKTGIAHSKLHERDEDVVLREFEHGDIQVLVNVGKFTAGYDNPSVDALIIARPTKSLALFIQISGRAVRLKKGKKDALLLDISGVIAQHGHPMQRRNFNRVRPPKGASEPIEFKDIECPHCGYTTQRKNMRKEQIVNKLHTINRLYCPNCEEIVDEVVNDTKEIARMQLVKDITNVKKVSDEKVGKFVEKIRAHKDYKPYWVIASGKKYNTHEHFKYELKLLYNKYKAKLITLDTAANTINKLSKEY